MKQAPYVLNQLINLVHRETILRLEKKYKVDPKVRHFGCRQQFICMVFAQLTWRDGLRSIQDCMNAIPEQLYHLGFSKPVSKSTLAYANEKRDWRIWQDVALHLIRKSKTFYKEESFSKEIEETVYALDSSTIDLSLALFPWAKFRRLKGGIKLHAQINLNNSIPTFVEVTQARMSDVKWLDHLVFEPNAIYVFDRGYIDFSRFKTIHESGAFFVTRAKSNIVFTRSKSINADFGRGILSDQIGYWKRNSSRQKYPGKIRKVKAWVPEKMEYVTYLTNHLMLAPDLVCLLYKNRWKIELFFKWIKQNLRIKHFYGNSLNAVKTQIWIAIATYVMIAIIHKKLNLPGELHRTLQILSVCPFHKVTLYELLTTLTPDTQNTDENQLLIFNDL